MIVVLSAIEITMDFDSRWKSGTFVILEQKLLGSRESSADFIVLIQDSGVHRNKLQLFEKPQVL